ncbi:MAG: hypothetical protein HOH43_02730 [Candidatus Latescibacteria bacterium]|nr:hypothetical protein [Candidatus Latescibacterota bacterium]
MQEPAGLDDLLHSYLKGGPPWTCRSTFHVHGIDLQISTPIPAIDQSVRDMMGFALTDEESGGADLTMYVIEEAPDSPSILDRFIGAELVLAWETTGYFVSGDLCLVDFYPWATAVIDCHRGVALLVLREDETPPPLIFSNQLFFQTLEVMLHSRSIYPIHSSVVAMGGRAALFPAPSGYGKTTLALTMVRAGYHFLGDDKPAVLSDSNGPRILAFPEPVNGYVDELHRFDELPHRPHEAFPADFPLKISFDVETFWPGCVIPSAIPAALFFPDAHDGDGPAANIIEPISGAEGLRHLIELNWPVRLPWGFDGFLDTMRDLVEQTPCYQLICGADLDDLPDRIGELIS